MTRLAAPRCGICGRFLRHDPQHGWVCVKWTGPLADYPDGEHL